MLDRSAPVFVAGHRGLVGSAILRRLSDAGFDDLRCADRADLDLRHQSAVDHVVARALNRPEPLDEVAVVVVLDLLVIYLGEVGVIGGRAGDRE